MSDRGWNSLPLPDGFDPSRSFITWMGIAQINNGNGAADGTYTKQTFLAGKIRTVIKPHPKGGVVSISIQMKYKLVLLLPAPRFSGLPDMPKFLEQDDFIFGCKWEYTFAQGRLSFGPGEQIAYPKIRGHRYLQGSCGSLQSKDQAGGAAMPWAYGRPQLELRSAPGDSSGWSFQLPYVGGPSYTPQGSGPTPDGGFSLGDFRIDLDVRAPKTPDPSIDLDPKLLQLTLNFELEGQRDISDARFHELKSWIEGIRRSNVYPVIQNGYLPLHIRGHASPTGTELRDQDLSTTRRQNVQRRLLPMINGNAAVVVWDQGKDASQAIAPEPKDPKKAYSMYRNVTVYIEPVEAVAALRRYNSAREKDQAE